MCGFGLGAPLDPTRFRDYIRGRFAHPERFDRILHFAKQRWVRSRDLRQSRRWLQIIDAVKRRSYPY